MSIAVDFYKGTYQEYLNQKERYNDNALYFCTDQQIMFKGKTLIGKPYQSLLSLKDGYPDVQLPIEDIIYLYDEENLIFAYVGGSWQKIFGNHICSIEHFNNTLNTVKWNPATRLLTLPQVLDPSNGAVTTLEINFGKDMILESGSYYDAELKAIRLKLAVPDADDNLFGDEYVDIPVGDLVDIYDVGNTSSIKLTLTPNGNDKENEQEVNRYLIKAEVILAPDQTKPNAIQKLSTGLYVDVQTYADQKCEEAKTYTNSRLSIAANKTVQDLLNEKANIEKPTLNNPVLNNPVLNGAIENNSLDVKENDLWTSKNFDSRVVTVEMLKDFISTQDTWGAIAHITTWGQLNDQEGESV